MARAALSDSFRRRAEAKRARSSSYGVTYLVTLHSGLASTLTAPSASLRRLWHM
ncbi:MAG: hypothetical protein L7H04_07005 [Vulcanisaeta sp.]|nr:hypothetical protein [Vulcanisaeta sp.]